MEEVANLRCDLGTEERAQDRRWARCWVFPGAEDPMSECASQDLSTGPAQHTFHKHCLWFLWLTTVILTFN